MSEVVAKKSDLAVRTASAVVMVTVAALALWFGGWIYSLFIIAVTIGLVWEWWGLSNKITDSVPGQFAWMLGGLIYIGSVSLVLLVLGSDSAMGGDHVARQLVLPLVLIVIATDTGAYFAGRVIGGPKIAPKISPSKTWAGLCGGMIAAAVTLVIWSKVDQSASNDDVVWLALIGALLAIVAQIGDFFESWMKRRAGVKDSGNLLPGHGGLLDRVDGLLPVVLVAAGSFMLMLVNSPDL